jgi:predicted nucleic acid-binding protein
MARALFDTNILIDWSKGYPEALAELMLWEHPAISVVTWVEFYGGAHDSDIPAFDEFLSGRGFEIVEIDTQIMQIAAAVVSARRRFGAKIQLADAIIEATAQVRGFTIVTRNTKDFKGRHVRVPYELKTTTTTTVTVINVRPPLDEPAGRT